MKRYRLWFNLLTFVTALIVALVPMSSSKRIHGRMLTEEREKVELWAAATQALATDDEEAPFDLMLRIISSNKTIPIILTDSSDHILTFNNIPIPTKADSASYLQKQLERLQDAYSPLTIDLGDEGKQYLYYGDSSTLQELTLFPLVQAIVFVLFLLSLFVALFFGYRNAQNRLWIGLSRETAHQLGTPISSLFAWITLLREEEADESILQEMEHDTARLEMISRRFQKIGSTPTHEAVLLNSFIPETIRYLEGRMSKGVTFFLSIPEVPIWVNINKDLFGWVLENLVKNGVDAMEGKGSITIEIALKGHFVLIDVTDTGKGIAPANRRKVFRAGFTTKKRGWGLGLSLAKRIMRSHPSGQIKLLSSEVGRGSTFRIRLKQLPTPPPTTCP